MDRIVVAFANEEAQRRILRLLASDGWEPAACCTSGAEAIRTVRKLGSAIVVCGFKLRDMTAMVLYLQCVPPPVVHRSVSSQSLHGMSRQAP